jgi:ATP-dependent Clp protease ATP-binding subunit ClpC
MQLANQEAQRFNHEYIGTEHILLGLVKEGAGVAANVLKNLDIDLRKIRLEVEKIVQSGPDAVKMGRLPQTPRAKKVIEYAIEECQRLKHNYVGTEHLLLGLVREEEGVASIVLLNLGVRLDDVREEVLNLLAHNPREQSGMSAAASRTPSLDSLGEDLTAQARDGRLGPCVGRANEIDRVLLVLGCRGDHSPVLVGPNGVGKQSIVRGLARLAAGPNPPEVLRGRRVVQVSMRAAVLATNNDSEKFVTCVRGLAGEARRAGNVLLFAGDLFGRTPANRLFKAVLDAGEVQYIAAATEETYRFAAGDEILGRGVQPVFVGLPPAEEVVAVLRAHRDGYEGYHGVLLSDDALLAAAELSERHLTDGCQPARALRLLDQAAVLFRLRHAPAPPDTAELDAMIARLECDKETAVAEQDFEKAAHLRDQADKLKKKRTEFGRESRPRRLLDAALDAAAVEQAVTKLTGVQFRGSDAIRARPEPGTA